MKEGTYEVIKDWVWVDYIVERDVGKIGVYTICEVFMGRYCGNYCPFILSQMHFPITLPVHVERRDTVPLVS